MRLIRWFRGLFHKQGMPEVYFHGATIGGYSARELKQVHDRAKGL
jgi:hypothetical protein